MASPKLGASSVADVDHSLTSNARIQKTVVGDGFCDLTPSLSDTVSVHYVGVYHGGVHHGRLFDSSRCRAEPLEFAVGKGEVFELFSVCVATMKLGETCELIVPSGGVFMVDGELKFTIELLDIRSQEILLEPMGSVSLSVVEGGEGPSVPLLGARAQIAYRQLRRNSTPEFHVVTYIVGRGFDSGVPECLDLAIRRMKKGERALVRQYEVANDTMTRPSKNMQKETSLYEIRLISFDETSSALSCSEFQAELLRLTKLKGAANEHFKNGEYLVAVSLYETLSDQVRRISATNSEREDTLSKLRTDTHLNLALSYLKVNQPVDCAELCRKVLDADSSNIKALFRLGQSFLLRNDPEEARRWFNRVLQVCPNNSAALGQLRRCTELLAASDHEVHRPCQIGPANVEKYDENDGQAIFSDRS